MPITTTLAQTAFKVFNFEVVSDEEQLVTYDIRTVYPKQAGIGANATSTTNDSQTYTINQTPTKFNIPIESSMASGEYVTTLRLFSSVDGCGTVLFSKVGVFYLEARDITVDPIQVTSENVEGVPQLTTSAPVVRANGVAIVSTDPFYAHYRFNNVCLSATNVDPTGNEFIANSEYFVGDQLYDPAASSYIWGIAGILPPDGAYEEWGKLTIGNADSFVNDPKFSSHSKPTQRFGVLITTDDTNVGYNLQDPAVTLVLGDVVGELSDYPVSGTIGNYGDYDDYKPDTVTMIIKSLPEKAQLAQFNDISIGTDGVFKIPKSDFVNYVNGADTTDPVVNLVNGTDYEFEVKLNFTDEDLYKPSQYRSAVKTDHFSDSLLPVSYALVVNSWTLNPAQDDGLMVSLFKTTQFMGTSAASYNLDANGVTTVLVEYHVLNENGTLGAGNWEPLSGGSINQGALTYSLDATNTTGVYTIPKNPTSAYLGPGQDYVNIYAEIPGMQANYKLLQFRMTLTTTNTSFAPTKRTSTEYHVSRSVDYTYSSSASVRYFPKPAVHNFTTDVPFITSSVDDVVAFSVPVSVPPFFKVVVTTDGVGAEFGSAAEYEYDGTSPAIDSHNVTGLSYPVSYTGATFTVGVQYVYLETTGPGNPTTVRKTIQQQGLLPITEASVVNSWTMNDTEGDGLVVLFAKTDQFMGTNDPTYNLDKYGVTTVLVEYSVLDSAGATTTWSPLSGGSITDYASPNYTLNAANTNGVYVVPKSWDTGNFGTSVKIYAEIPDQADYNLVAVRLTLRTDSAAYAPQITNLSPNQAPIQVSDAFSAPAPAGYTYPFTASVRYLPAPVDHDFDTYKPLSQLSGLADSIDQINFTVPMTVPRYFRSSVTTSGGTVTGTATIVGDDDSSVYNGVTGLSYAPTDNETFELTVSYKYSENNAVTTTPQSMPVQMQGFPNTTDKGFTIGSASWNQNTQKVDYLISMSATATSAVRMDGWNVYTKLSTDSAYVFQGNVLKSAGLTQSLAVSYDDYSIIDVKVVATRSKYLSSTETTEQTETNTNDVTAAGIQTAQFTILPNTLPKPTADDIVLSNFIYDTNAGGSQYSELIVDKGSTVYSIKLIDANNTADETIKTTNPSVYQIPITSTPTTRQFHIMYGYSSSGSAPVYSDPTILEFKTGVNHATAPVIHSKQYVNASNFAIGYTGGSTAGSSNSDGIALVSSIHGKIDGTPTDIDFGLNDGTINATEQKDTSLKIQTQNKFSSSYKVDTTIKALEQTINGPESASFRVAANPSIVSSSIVVRPTLNTITFDVRNNGDPYMDTALVVYAQDPGSNNGDKGTFGIALFQNPAGFQVGVSQTNVFRGGLVNGEPTTAAHTLTASAITGTGYDKITRFTFQSATVITTTNANVVMYVANAIEGSDSLVMADITPTITIIPQTVNFSGYGGALTFMADNHPFNVGDRIVYADATGNLGLLNGTYTVSSIYNEQIYIHNTSSSLSTVPAIFSSTPNGTITYAPALPPAPIIFIPRTVTYAGYGGGILFFVDNHPFQVGNRIVYSGATGDLEQINGTYTVSSSFSGSFAINEPPSGLFNVPAFNNFNPDGTITLAP